jgi:hypothetical protein
MRMLNRACVASLLFALSAPAQAAPETDWSALAAQGYASSDEQDPTASLSPGQLQELMAPNPPLQGSYRMEVHVVKRPSGLGITREFVVLLVDGRARGLFVASTAREGQFTREGESELEIETSGGQPYPWHRSSTYGQSSMYWGLRFAKNSLYWVHATPHYGELGAPASMGCVRVDYPAAMEMWDTAVHEVAGSAKVVVHASGSASARDLVARLGVDSGWINDRIAEDLDDAHRVSTGDYSGRAHARQGEQFVVPACSDGASCFTAFGLTPPSGALQGRMPHRIDLPLSFP